MRHAVPAQLRRPCKHFFKQVRRVAGLRRVQPHPEDVLSEGQRLPGHVQGRREGQRGHAAVDGSRCIALAHGGRLQAPCGQHAWQPLPAQGPAAPCCTCCSVSAAACGPRSRRKHMMRAAVTPWRAGAWCTARSRPGKNSAHGTPLAAAGGRHGGAVQGAEREGSQGWARQAGCTRACRTAQHSSSAARASCRASPGRARRRRTCRCAPAGRKTARRASPLPPPAAPGRRLPGGRSHPHSAAR